MWARSVRAETGLSFVGDAEVEPALLYRPAYLRDADADEAWNALPFGRFSGLGSSG